MTASSRTLADLVAKTLETGEPQVLLPDEVAAFHTAFAEEIGPEIEELRRKQRAFAGARSLMVD